MANFLKFPDGFLWGASTSSHQVEGNNHNNWTVWEEANAQRLASQAEKRFSHWLPAWNEIKSQAQDPKNYISGLAANHYNLFEKDFDIMKELGMNAYRFSIEWSRIEPEMGKFNEEEIYHYKKMIKALKERNIEPFVTLWHWTFPTWASELGGWSNPKVIDYFCRYVQMVVGLLPEVKFWITLNETGIFASETYLLGHWPPQKKSRFKFYMILNNMATAHMRAYDDIHSVNPNVCVGMCENIIYYEPVNKRILNKIAAAISSWWSNKLILVRMAPKLDFIGVNYYFRNIVNLYKERTVSCVKSDIGWDACAYGIYDILKGLKMYNKPIYITENGIADAKDYLREGVIKDTLINIHKAIEDGVDVKGYLHWSLLDNFEWDKGFWPRFGLVEVDFKTQERKIRDSARKFAEVIAKNGLEEF